MLAMNFPVNLTSLIMRCICSVVFSILVNGYPIPSFASIRGICQGDPLSPIYLLFVLKASLSWYVMRRGKLYFFVYVLILIALLSLTPFSSMTVLFFVKLTLFRIKLFMMSFTTFLPSLDRKWISKNQLYLFASLYLCSYIYANLISRFNGVNSIGGEIPNNFFLKPERGERNFWG